MKTYLIQRNLPKAGALTLADRKAIAQRSCAVISELGTERIEWIKSYVTGDNIWCIYKAEEEEILREHARKGGFPCNEIFEIHATLSPATADLVI